MVARVVGEVSPGARATLTVRPERIRLSASQPDDTPNAFVGEIYESVYVGFDMRYRVRLTPTLGLSVRQQNTLPIGMPAMEGPEGVRIWISWLPDSARVLPE
jgi:ABC-type Fe3+/spermidine/putrescine transport system ATPase subunit